MRDKRFIAEHRGGPLKKEEHRQLISWACKCAEHVLPLLTQNPDRRLSDALHIAKEWEKGNVPAGEAMKASVSAHAAAREYSDPVSIAVARAVGHAAATAHMADHSIGPAIYGLKAVKYAGRSVEDERKWQYENLYPDIRELVISAINRKKGLRDQKLRK